MANVRVRDLMTTDVVVFDPDDTLHEAIQRLASNGISAAPVVSDGRVRGVLSESDVLNELSSGAPVTKGFSWLDAVSLIIAARYPHEIAAKRVSDIMTVPATTIAPDAEVWRAATVMHRERVKRLPVVNAQGELEGIVSRADLVAAMAKDDAGIRRDVIAAIDVLGEETFKVLEVDVVEGVATVEGIADRRSTRDIAIRLASKTPGVVEVRDRLEFDFDDAHVSSPAGSGRLEPRRNWNDMVNSGDPVS